jgi:hypothetical protein
MVFELHRSSAETSTIVKNASASAARSAARDVLDSFDMRPSFFLRWKLIIRKQGTRLLVDSVHEAAGAQCNLCTGATAAKDLIFGEMFLGGREELTNDYCPISLANNSGDREDLRRVYRSRPVETLVAQEKRVKKNLPFNVKVSVLDPSQNCLGLTSRRGSRES